MTGHAGPHRIESNRIASGVESGAKGEAKAVRGAARRGATGASAYLRHETRRDATRRCRLWVRRGSRRGDRCSASAADGGGGRESALPIRFDSIRFGDY